MEHGICGKKDIFMAKFITGDELENAICRIIWDAKKTLLIVSPFIRLDSHFMKIFGEQIKNTHLHLIVVFGKNEQDRSRSLCAEDFEFFKQFPCVSIIYVPNLHAKYYGNEDKGVITSVNMYDYSFKNNIEFGVFYENSILDSLTKSSDQAAWNECIKIAEGGEPVFIKRPVFKKKLIGLLGKDYMSSTVLLDNTDSSFAYGRNSKQEWKKLPEFPNEIDFGEKTSAMPTREETQGNYYPPSQERPSRERYNNSDEGFCIRTGVKITFDPMRPFCYEAYRSWAQFGNPDYPENYCHRTGRKSNGRTSMRNPVLNW